MAAHSLVSLQHVASTAENVAEELLKHKSRVPDAQMEIMAMVAGLYGFCSTLYQFDLATKNHSTMDGEVRAKLNSMLRGSMNVLKELKRIINKIEIANTLANSSLVGAWKEVSRLLKDPESALEARIESYKDGMSSLVANMNSTISRSGRQPSRIRREAYDRHRAVEEYESQTSPSDFDMALSPVTDHSSTFPTSASVFPSGRRGSFSARVTNSYYDDYLSQQFPFDPHIPLPQRRRSSYMPLVDTEFVQYIDPIEGSDGSNSSQTSRDIYQNYYHPSLTSTTTRTTSTEIFGQLAKISYQNTSFAPANAEKRFGW